MKKSKLYSIFALVVIASFLFTACGNNRTPAVTSIPGDSILSPDAVVAEGHLLPVHAANLSFQVRGVVESVNVKIGDTVLAGDVLARLSSAPQAEAQVTSANLELVIAQYDYDTLIRNGDANLATVWTAYMNTQDARAEAEREWEDLNLDNIDDRIEDAETDIRDRKEDLQDAQDEFDRYKDLDKDNSRRKSAEDDLEKAQEDYNEAVRDLEDIQRERDSVRARLDAAIALEAEAKYQFDKSSGGANADQIMLAEARLENAKQTLKAAQSVLANYVIVAPFDGTVVDVDVRVGEQLGSENRAVSIADTSSWIIETSDITELEVVDIAVGQAVSFVADALPSVTMSGVVSEISQSSYTQNGDVLYTVRIKANNQGFDSRLKWGMTVEVTFEAAE